MNDTPAFIKWAGGKKRLIEQFKPLFPKEAERYFEPFVGGGAIAFYIIQKNHLKEIYLSDINEELINCYETIRDEVEGLIVKLKQHRASHNKEYYYAIR